ncbi:MAG: hypothetical protein QG608_856 [Actinomycetota bacterium]|nr:hypothetical protein [Actinomycetota bacterium]
MICRSCGYDYRTRQMGSREPSASPPESKRPSLASALLQQTAAMPILDSEDEPAKAVPAPQAASPASPLDHVTRVGPAPVGPLPPAAQPVSGLRPAPSGPAGPDLAVGPTNRPGAFDPAGSLLRSRQEKPSGTFGSIPPDVTRVGPNVPVGPGAESVPMPPVPPPTLPRTLPPPPSALPSAPAGVPAPAPRVTSLPKALANLGFPDPAAPEHFGSQVPPESSGPPGDPERSGHSGNTARWVAEIWVDPEWYADQEADDPCPPDPGGPDLVPLTGKIALIGRRSLSRNIHPTLECGSDTGVSRRHARLSTDDGQRWWVEDLESANGTYVGSPDEPLPLDPLAPGERVELTENDHIYLGAWTRIALRPAAG